MKKFLLKTEWRSLAARLQARPRTTSATHRDQHPRMAVLPIGRVIGNCVVVSKSLASGGGRRCTNDSTGFGLGPPLQGVRQVGCPGFVGLRQQHRRRHVAGSPARRNLGPQRGERRGGAGIGRKQAMDGLRSPVGARDGGIRRCARSPHCRGSPRSRWTPALFKLTGSGIPQLGDDKKTRPGDCRALWCCSLASDQFWTFSSVRRFSSLLQPGMVCGVETSGRLSP